jgi:hypothetical protein
MPRRLRPEAVTALGELGDIERRRLRSFVEVRLEEAVALHAPDFQLVHPGVGQEAGPLECWHLDCYRRDEGAWRVRWSQATSIAGT